MKAIVLVLLAGLLVVWSEAHAAGQTANLSWTLATQFTDGTTFTAAETASEQVRACWTPVAGTGAVGGCATSPPAATGMQVHINCGQVMFTAQTLLNGALSAATAPILYDTGLQCVQGVSGARVTN